MPELPESQRTSGRLRMRYEDIIQDGRINLLGVPPSVAAVWGQLVERTDAYRALSQRGIFAILTRLVARRVQPGGPISLPSLAVAGGYQYAHGVDEAGEVARIFMNMWTRLEGPVRCMYGAQPANAGEVIPVAELFVEHTMTRPFGPPEQRKVLSLDGIPHMPDLPPLRHDWERAEALLDLPPGVTDADPELIPAVAETVFGLEHTDSNQHVNSLAYPKVFIDEALRRFAARGLPTRVSVRQYDARFRKPCFAGDRMRVHSRAFLEAPGRPGLVAGIFEAGADPAGAKPHATIRLSFEP